MRDFLFRGSLADLDPDVAALVDLEEIRQAKRLILIPSESSVPAAVREAVGSVYHNLYAEGYPSDDWRTLSQSEILDIDLRLAEYRRYSDPRYYKGTEFADIVESLARRRAAELFATDNVGPDDLWVNVQPLSGSPANSAVYSALLDQGDTLMGLNLLHGGHLSHGSPVSRSGIVYNVVSYSVDPETDRLNYDQIRALALEHRPKIIVAGFTSYPYAPDWAAFRKIADEVGAYLLADISHVSGLVAARVFPSPVGYADVISFTTHKTLTGPRGAVLMTTDRSIGKKLDRAVFPGEQGGPHVNAIVGMAVAFRLAGTEQFRVLQQQIIANAQRLAERLAARGLHIPHGGTESHLLLVDCKTIVGEDGTPLSGDMAARILDLAGIVCNRNTIPGDKSAFSASGIRIGTPWVTQRGFREPEIDRLANIMADLLQACEPFSYPGGRPQRRAKVPYDALVRARQQVHRLAASAGIDYEVPGLSAYPKEADAAAEHFRVLPEYPEHQWDWSTIDVYGPRAADFLAAVLTSDVYDLVDGEYQPAWVLGPGGTPMTRAILHRIYENTFHLHVEDNVEPVASWLRTLSDGFVQFDAEDVYAKVPGPVSISPLSDTPDMRKFDAWDINTNWAADGTGYQTDKAYFIGCNGPLYDGPVGKALPQFGWTERDGDLQVTTLHALHKELGAKMVPFAGYDMPVWYESVSAEHAATRTGAGLFDVSHMGVFDFTGPGAEPFLNALTANDVTTLAPGEAHYSYLLGVDGIPIDDIFVYRLAPNHFLMVVNAANNDKDWAWINGLLRGDLMADRDRPWVTLPGRDDVDMRDLRNPALGADRRVDIALQGPKSRDVLLSWHGDAALKAQIKRLPWAGVVRGELGGYDLIITRTGYTGERVAFELFVNPDDAPRMFKDLVESGATPIGLAARDSLRTEAGLPLYGHELAGDLNLNPADAGFGSFVKLWKPFFVGKTAYMAHERERDAVVTRFRLDSKGVRAPHPGDPLLDERGRVVGIVTSCSIDSEGYQLGQAYLKLDYADEGTRLFVYQGAERVQVKKPFGELALGDKTVVPSPVTVQSRFPRRKK